MFQPTDAQIEAIFAHAAEAQPMEACGVIANGEYVRMQNTATAKGEFAFDMRAYRDLANEREIEAVAHSHVYLPPVASDADRAMCEATGLPWLILGWPTKAWAVIEPNGWEAPLVGRSWAWGSLDCFSLVRDAFKAYTGIVLPDFDRDWNFWKKGQDLIGKHYAEAGFVRLAQDTMPQHCDIVGMRVDSPVVNHLGILINDPLAIGGTVLLHQLRNRLSVREVYGGTYRFATELHLRHKSLMEVAA